MATWPSSLPAPLLSGFKPQWKPNVLRTQMEVGKPRSRVLTREKRLTMPLAFHLNFAQNLAFDAWYQSETGANLGANHFTANWDIGFGIKTYECLLMSEPSPTVLAPQKRYRLEFGQVELREV